MGTHVDPAPSGPGRQISSIGLHRLLETGLLLARERDPETIAQVSANFAHSLSDSAFGVFLLPASEPPPVGSHKVSGLRSEMLSAPIETFLQALGEPARQSQVPVRLADIARDERYRELQVYAGGYPHVRSYLAVPVQGSSGDLLGRLIVAHEQGSAFSEEVEFYLVMLADQTGAALETARHLLRLGGSVTREHRILPAAGTAPHPPPAARVAHAAEDDAARLKLALDAAQLGTWTWDRSSDRIDLDSRAAALFHVLPHEAITRSTLRDRMVDVSDRALTRDQLNTSLDLGKLYTAEYRVNAPDGSQNWVCAHGLPTKADSGQIDGMVGVVQDTTARKNQEAALRQSEKLAATGRLAAAISHEINNPLEAVMNLIYLARTDPQTPVSVRRGLEMADDELCRVAHIAQQTLGFYRDTSRPVEIDLNTLLAEVVDLFGRRLLRKSLKCTVELEPDLRIFGLRGEIRQVFSNLLINAIDASTTGTIRMRGRHCHQAGHDGVSVLLSDEGAGIPKEVRQHLFSPFFTTKEVVGTGLGLWVTRGIVEKQGGAIAFRSCTFSPTGTVFRVYLPSLHGVSAGTAPSSLIQ